MAGFYLKPLTTVSLTLSVDPRRTSRVIRSLQTRFKKTKLVIRVIPRQTCTCNPPRIAPLDSKLPNATWEQRTTLLTPPKVQKRHFASIITLHNTYNATPRTATPQFVCRSDLVTDHWTLIQKIRCWNSAACLGSDSTALQHHNSDFTMADPSSHTRSTVVPPMPTLDARIDRSRSLRLGTTLPKSQQHSQKTATMSTFHRWLNPPFSHTTIHWSAHRSIN